MILKPNVSYVLKTESGFFRNVVLKHLLYLNESVGVFTIPSLFGKYVSVSDEDVPTRNKCVISFVDRNSDDFVVVRLDEQWLSLFFELNGFKNSDFSKFMQQPELKFKSLEQRYMLFLQLMNSAWDGSKFNREIAVHVMNNRFSRDFKAVDYESAVIEFISKKSLNNFLHLSRVFAYDLDLKRFQSVILNILKDTLTSTSKGRYFDVLSSFSFKESTVLVGGQLFMCAGYDDFFLSLLNLVEV